MSKANDEQRIRLERARQIGLFRLVALVRNHVEDLVDRRVDGDRSRDVSIHVVVDLVRVGA